MWSIISQYQELVNKKTKKNNVFTCKTVLHRGFTEIVSGFTSDLYDFFKKKDKKIDGYFPIAYKQNFSSEGGGMRQKRALTEVSTQHASTGTT